MPPRPAIPARSGAGGRSLSRAKDCGRIFSATSRPRRVSRARYTSPIPPAPSGPTTSYGPSLVPGTSAMIGRDYNPVGFPRHLRWLYCPTTGNPEVEPRTASRAGSRLRGLEARFWIARPQQLNAVTAVVKNPPREKLRGCRLWLLERIRREQHSRPESLWDPSADR